MYCKSCGAENQETAIYCVNDGALLKSFPAKYRKKESTSAFCSSCGESVSASDNYCENCGESVIKYEHKKGAFPKVVSTDYPREVTPKLGGIPAFQWPNLKRAAIPALIAIVIVFVISFSMMASSEKVYDSLMNDAMKGYDLNQMFDAMNSKANLGISKPGRLVGVTDILMWANLQNPHITFKTGGNLGLGPGSLSMDFFIKNGFFIYLLIPFIGLFAAGIYAGRKTRGTDLLNRLTDSVGIAIIYAVFCTIVSFFAGFSYNANISQMGFKLSLDVNTDYSFLKTLLMSLLIGFLFSSLGILFSTNFKKVTGHLAEMAPFGEAIHQAIAVPIRGIFMLFVISFAVLASKVSEFKAQFSTELAGTPLETLINQSYGLICGLSLQLGTYIWNLLHLTSLSFAFEGVGDKGSLAYHLFSGVKPDGQFGALEAQPIDAFLASSHIKLYLILALIIPIVLFILAGMRMAKQPSKLKNLVVFSIVYAIIMLGIASFSDIGFTFSQNGDGTPENMSMMLGFSPFITFICSLIFSFIFAYIGTWIQKFLVK